MQSLKRLIHEVHRRSLWQVLAIYLAGSWGALQVVGDVSDSAGLPPWVSSAALVLLVIGMPIVLATAFVQEGGPRAARAEGDVADRAMESVGAAAPAQTVGQRLLTWRHAMMGGALAFAMVLGAAAVWVFVGGGAAVVSAPEPLRSVAVLPFVTRSDSAADKFFAEGMHDDLLTQLSKIDSLIVISRTSVAQYAATEKRIPEIARELGVTAIVEGGIQRSGTRIRVNVQLIDAVHDRHLWAETYNEELTAANVFTIQSDLARKIAQALRATLTPSVQRRLDTRPTESLAAWELYSSARYAFNTRGAYGEDLDLIIGQLKQALEEDPNFAGAWSTLANAYLAAANWNRMTRDTALPLAREAIARALAADPDLADAHISRSRLLSFEGRFDEAEKELVRAIELNPGMASAYERYSNLLEELRRPDEAAEAARRAVELDPMSLSVRNTLADRYFFAGRWVESMEESRKAIVMAPTDWYAWYNVAWSYAATGQVREAVDAFHESARHTQSNTPSVYVGLAYAFARGGQRDSALSYLRPLDKDVVGYDYALVHFTLGDVDIAYDALEDLLRTQPQTVLRLEIDPTAAAMRAHPRFTEIRKRLGL